MPRWHRPPPKRLMLHWHGLPWSRVSCGCRIRSLSACSRGWIRSQKAVYYQLFLLSHGFRRDTRVVGLAKLAKSVPMSQRKVQDTIVYLERRGLIKRLRALLGGPSKGNVYQLPILAADMAPGSIVANDATMAPHATIGPGACVAPHATNKKDDMEMPKRSPLSRRPG